MKSPQQTQIPLSFPERRDYSEESFHVGDFNLEAREAIAAFPNWAKSGLIITGDEGTGKTHLGHIWQTHYEALHIVPQYGQINYGLWRGRALWIDQASEVDEESLFAALNMALMNEVKGVLLTDRLSPHLWSIEIPDLRSRLYSLRVVKVLQPDDADLRVIMNKLFVERGLRVADNILDFLLKRMERSVSAARVLVNEIDSKAAREKAKVTRKFVAQFFDTDFET